MVRVAKAINSPEVFYKIAVLKNFTKFTEILVPEFIF